MRDMVTFVTAAVDEQGLVSHMFEAYNQLVDHGLAVILQKLFNISRTIRNTRVQKADERAIDSYKYTISFRDVVVGKPTQSAYASGQLIKQLPSHARLTGEPYVGSITLSATVTITANYADGQSEEKIAEIPPFQMGNFPIMVGSIKCPTYNCTPEMLKGLGEDPAPNGGGYFIYRDEYVIALAENLTFNKVLTAIPMRLDRKYVQSEIISQRGGAFDNSSQLRVSYNINGSLTIEINSTKFADVKMPVLLMFILFGMTDREAVKAIVFDTNSGDPITKRMLGILADALYKADIHFAPLLLETNRERLIQKVAERLAKHLTNPNAYASNEHAVRYLNTDLLITLDRVFLPHMGTTQDDRVAKLKFLGLMVHKTFLVHFGVVPSVNRDSLTNKRGHSPGESLAKVIKTIIAVDGVGPASRALLALLRNEPWQNITVGEITSRFRATMSRANFDRAIQQMISSGSKETVITPNRLTVRNRLGASDRLELKNEYNRFSSLRTAQTLQPLTQAKSAKRTLDMREVDASFAGYFCIYQSPDTGPKVGIPRQLAITATTTVAGEPLMLREELLRDPEIERLDRVDSADMLKGMSRVFVNGEWIGCGRDTLGLALKYRAARREGRGAITPKTSVCWDPVTRELQFWLDAGRFIRPLLIVYNNVEEYDAAVRAGKPVAFRQWTRFSRAHVRGILAERVRLKDLIKEGVAEFVAADECDNCLVAESIEELRESRSDVTRQFTHVDVGQALLGLATLSSPFGNHTQPVRVTYQTSQVRQANGWPVLNVTSRYDKNLSIQHRIENPLVSTLARRFVRPTSTNLIVAYASYGGNNQEDSVYFKKAASDWGTFNVSVLTTERVVLEKGETIETPDPLRTQNLRMDASYEKLDGGLPRVGARITYGNAIVGRVRRLTQIEAGSPYVYEDASVVYRSHEPAVVDDVQMIRGAKEMIVVLVRLRHDRRVEIGNKSSTREGNKCIIASLVPQSDMPFTESGITPDIIVNTHSQPTRMTIGQQIETYISKPCAVKGQTVDGTTYLPLDLEVMTKEMVRLGFRANGRERMYNGKTGTYFDAAIFIGPTAFQCIQKYAVEEQQAVGGNSPTDAMTGQPLRGKKLGGGLRLGEMEVTNLMAHGALFTMHEKIGLDSNYRPLHICRRCSGFAVYNEFRRIYSCRTCGELADIATVNSSKSAKLLLDELAGANIRVKLDLRPRMYE